MALNPVPGTAGDDPNLLGTGGDDKITALQGNDNANGLEGNDLVLGHAGDDILNGGNGDDKVYGGLGNDVLSSGGTGSAQTDELYGDAGDDSLSFFSDNGGEAYGGIGTDQLVLVWGGATAITLDFSLAITTATQGALSVAIEGMERLTLFGSSVADIITGGAMDDFINVAAGANVVDAGDGDDQVEYIDGASQDLDGGNGTDLLGITASGASLNFNVSGGVVTDGFGSTLLNFERFAAYGGTGNDVVTFGAGQDFAFLNGGNDVASGGGNGDILEGQGGNDLLRGQSGNDRIVGGAGIDTLFGGTGGDTFVFSQRIELGDMIRDYSLADDQLQIGSAVTNQALSGGQIPIVSVGAAVGTDAQFIVTYLAASNTTRLTFDENGTDGGGAILVTRFLGNIAIDAGEILMFGS